MLPFCEKTAANRPRFLHLNRAMLPMVVDWNEVQAISTSVLVLTSAGAIGYAALQLRHERAYRAVDNLEKQLTFFASEGYQSARRRLAQARLDGEVLLPCDPHDPPVAALEVLDFYEHLGLLVKKGHLDAHDAWHTFYEWAQPVYLDMQPLIECTDGPFLDHYSDLRRLMRRMNDIEVKRMQAKNANLSALFTQERVLDYYRYELQAGGASRRVRRSRARTHALASPSEVVEELKHEEMQGAGRK